MMDLGHIQVGKPVYPGTEAARERPHPDLGRKVGIKGVMNNIGLCSEQISAPNGITRAEVGNVFSVKGHLVNI